MIIGGLQKSSLLDYPGKICAIVFTMGCPLRCRYCHNPSLVLPNHFPAPIPEWQVLEFLETRRTKLEGVTISGGEPTMQKDLADFMATVKGMGFSVKLDTTGVNPEVLRAVVMDGLADYIAMDVKAPFARYQEVCGVPVDANAVRKSIDIIRDSGIDYEFRTTVVKGQLSESDIVEIAKSIGGAKRYFLQRFRSDVTLDPRFRKMRTYSDAEFEQIRQSAAAHVLACEVR